MAATDLNTVRSTIEPRLATELASSPAIPVVFNNMTFDSTAEDTFVQCVTSFGNNTYLTQGGASNSGFKSIKLAISEINHSLSSNHVWSTSIFQIARYFIRLLELIDQ